MKKTIVLYLLGHNIRPHLKGFDYLVAALLYTTQAEIKPPIGTVYEIIAEQYHTSAAAVERCIRGAIESAFPRGYKPPNSEFISRATVELTSSLVSQR